MIERLKNVHVTAFFVCAISIIVAIVAIIGTLSTYSWAWYSFLLLTSLTSGTSGMSMLVVRYVGGDEFKQALEDERQKLQSANQQSN